MSIRTTTPAPVYAKPSLIRFSVQQADNGGWIVSSGGREGDYFAPAAALTDNQALVRYIASELDVIAHTSDVYPVGSF